MNTNKFRWGKIRAKANSTTFYEVKALIYGDTGLAINQYDPSQPNGKFTSVTHVRSGLRLSLSFNDAKTARLFCMAASELIDWNELDNEKVSAEELQALGKRVRQVREYVVNYKTNWKTKLVEDVLNGELTK